MSSSPTDEPPQSDAQSNVQPNHPNPDPLLQAEEARPSPGTPAFGKLSHLIASHFLQDAEATGKLGNGRAEPSSNSSLLAVLQTIPWGLLTAQLIWSSFILAIAYLLADRPDSGFDTLSAAFWVSRLNVPTSISYGVGWALFVLLGFFIREASERYRDGQEKFLFLGGILRQIIRTVRQSYPQGTWHAGDIERIASHLVAMPIAVKMTVRGERDPSQLEKILHPDDLHDVLNSGTPMHVHCARVVRAYMFAAHQPENHTFSCVENVGSAGLGSRFVLFERIDTAESFGNAVTRIGEFRPSLAYVNHLQIFLYIWMMFLPLALVGSSGWFTVLWSLLISYGIGMLYNIAHALNEPFGFDIQDIKLNKLSAGTARSVLVAYSIAKLEPHQVIDEEHETPSWLEAPASDEFVKPHFSSSPRGFSLSGVSNALKRFRLRPLRLPVAIGLLVFILWSCFIIFLTWGISKDDQRAPGVRWWAVYIPFSVDTAGYVSLGVFLLLGFWINDAYGRYWRGLQLWPNELSENLENLAFEICMSARPGVFHQRDHERVLSHIVALPIVVKLFLRKSNDLSELDGILSRKDIARFSESPNCVIHVLCVLQSYLHRLDIGDLKVDPGQLPAKLHIINMIRQIMNIEGAVGQCVANQKFQISSAFTTHLRLFTAFWLAVLPLTIVIHDGFLSFIYLIPIGYSIINLLSIGSEVADPFGYDEHDIPLDMFCKELKDSVYAVYQDSRGGLATFCRESNYKREDFEPKLWTDPTSKQAGTQLLPGSSSDDEKDVLQRVPSGTAAGPTVLGSFWKIINSFPSVSWPALGAVVFWSIGAVFASWGFSKLWDDDAQQENCGKWCSPIDIEGSVLANIGFALFLLLAFRATEGIGRYDKGAEYIYNMERELRTLAVELVQSFNDGVFHPGDKERIVAHIAQIPLCFRDTVLGIDRTSPDMKEGLLSEDDRDRFERSCCAPLEHLFHVVQSYLLMEDTNYKKTLMAGELELPVMSKLMLQRKFAHMRDTVISALSLKRFPTVPSFTNHQHVFTAVWLILLPLSMTSQTGFFTILWAPLVSYGVLAMESIASELVDPFGTDATDIPVDMLCTRAANTVLQAVRCAGWDIEPHLESAPIEADPVLNAVIRGREVHSDYILPVIPPISSDSNSGPTDQRSALFRTPHEAKAKPSLYAHLLRSVPWWLLAVITGWTVVGCVISYVVRLRGESEAVRWWVSFISVNGNVATYVSFAAFALLAFFVNSSFMRYHRAGYVWGDSLRSLCHFLAGLFLKFTARDSMHKGDHDRLIGHLAALPLLLKLELRDSRDMREVMGLLSYSDIARVQRAASMSNHCIDVIRSYWVKGASNRWRSQLIKDGNGEKTIIAYLWELEQAVNFMLFLKTFDMAPGFILLLNTLIGLFFAVLPFVLAELSGWFTILWVLIIAYGVLGMHSVALELRNPFGTDLNDLDLDQIADEIVEDVLVVYDQQKAGHGTLIEKDAPAPEFWKLDSAWAKETSKRKLFTARDAMPVLGKLKESLGLAWQAVPMWMLTTVVVWAAVIVAIAYAIGRHLPLSNGAAACKPWFCSAIAIDGSVLSYIGFALFLLLGFRMVDSHSRFSTALALLQGGMVGTSRLAMGRVFQAYPGGTFHEGDMERIAGHIAAFCICIKGSLRNQDYTEELQKYLHEDDVLRVLSAQNRVEYCLDVFRAYLLDGDRMDHEEPGKHPANNVEHLMLIDYSRRLAAPATGCQRIIRVPLPFGYVQHLRIFLLIWIVFLPLGLVESTGWLTIFWVGFISYGVIGIERWSQELSDPFGFDVSDVPLDELVDRAIATLKVTLDQCRKSVHPLIKSDRQAFPVGEEEVVRQSWVVSQASS